MYSVAKLVSLMCAFATLSGCRTSSEPTEQLRLRVGDEGGNPEIGLVEGASFRPMAELVNAVGQRVHSSGKPSLIVRHPSVARIDTTGRVFGLTPGTTYVVASLVHSGRTYRDSVKVFVQRMGE